MRLAQLARKLNVKPAEIRSLLEQKDGKAVDENPNLKLTDKQVEYLNEKFSSKAEEEVVAEIIEDKAETTELEKEAVAEEQPQAPIELKITPPPAASGPKIIGKIDLPDTSKIEVEVDGVVYSQEELDLKKKEEQKALRAQKAQQKEEKRKADEARRLKEKEKRETEALRLAVLKEEQHNLLSAEEEKKKAEKEKIRLKREKALAKKKKQNKKKHYEQLHATKTSHKPKKKKSAGAKVNSPATNAENTSASDIVIEDNTKKNLFQRFIKWLNT